MDSLNSEQKLDRKFILIELVSIIKKAFSRDDLEISRQTSARDVPGWDSFKMVEIVLSAEERFSIEFSAQDVDRFRCVGDMVEAIADKVTI